MSPFLLATAPAHLSKSVPVDDRCGRLVKRTGQSCKRRPINGGTVCPMHGGSAPQVKARALERLAALVDPAITELGNLLRNEFAPIRLATVKDILDRNGIIGKQQHELSGSATFTLRIDRGDSEPD